VIKPTGSALGNGVLIVEVTELDALLKKMLVDKELLLQEEDPALKYWATSHNQTFIVEKFYHSDAVKHSDGKLYDGTMRAVILMHYEQNKIEYQLVDLMWKLPEFPIGTNNASLNAIYKSCGMVPFFAPVKRTETRQVRKQLQTIFPRLYQRMLDQFLESEEAAILGLAA
jgi:hypothetical protein